MLFHIFYHVVILMVIVKFCSTLELLMNIVIILYVIFIFAYTNRNRIANSKKLLILTREVKYCTKPTLIIEIFRRLVRQGLLRPVSHSSGQR